MQKRTLETFIKRYSLDGICETAHWYSDGENKTLTARAHTEAKTVILKIIMKEWNNVETCQLAIPSSTKLKKMLSPLGDDVSIELNKIGDKIKYGMFSVGLFIYDYENGKIDWVSSEPLIQDTEAVTITFASQFVETKPGEGILYAHVDDSFVRAYTLFADGIKKLLPIQK
jgi:hypothetical protein